MLRAEAVEHLSRPDAKLIFLDVDGVLHPSESTSEADFFRESCVLALEHLLRETGARVVLSSAWREFDARRPGKPGVWSGKPLLGGVVIPLHHT